MTREEALNKAINIVSYFEANFAKSKEAREDLENIIEALEQEPCEMTAEDYRQRMMQAFHNADCDELIAVCVLPTEKEFEHLEGLLKNHYKKEPCEDAVSRQAVIDILDDMTKDYAKSNDFEKVNGVAWVTVQKLPSVNPQKIGHWILTDDDFVYCSECEDSYYPRPIDASWYYCPNCGAKMVESQETETWNGIHTQITAPKGTFDRLFNEADDDNDI